MADARSKAVLGKLADLVSQNVFLPDVASTSLREPLAKGDVIEVPAITDLTITASGADANPEAVSTAVLTLTADLHPWINAKLPERDSMQLMDGAWAAGVAAH